MVVPQVHHRPTAAVVLVLCSLTVGEVRRGEAVVHEDTVGFSHFQVDHIGGVFQGSDGVLMAHLLQASAVHLRTERRVRTKGQAGPAAVNSGEHRQ